ncbi:MAG TPA: hypothetical protein VJU54_05835 [Nitrospiraceae bacterium]|nr:hypothetical protein [Nitrospiraceae bacterium]
MKTLSVLKQYIEGTSGEPWPPKVCHSSESAIAEEVLMIMRVGEGNFDP